MNIATLLAGDIVADNGLRLASKFVKGIINRNSNFASLLSDESHAINIEDLDLNKEQELELAKIRSLAMDRGIEKVEVEIEGSKFNLNIKDNTLSAVI